MKPMNLEQVVRNVDRRLDRVEQILPTLPTRDEMHAALETAIRGAVAPLVTREEFERRVATLVTKEQFEQKVATLLTKEEFERKLDERIATLATKEELDRKLDERIATLATKAELREEFERSRRHTQVLFESLMDRISIVADGFAATDMKINHEIRPRLDNHERRLTALEDAEAPTGSGHRN